EEASNPPENKEKRELNQGSWDLFIEELKKENPKISTLLITLDITSINKNMVTADCGDAFTYQQIQRNKGMLQKLLNKFFKEEISFHVDLNKKATPKNQKEPQDKGLQNLLNVFDGDIV
ncbi:MAG: hypothetical protein PHE86_05760, partial [Candidatus Marinimicrobia bacterium]|nr:hypothetical protein [Candidatus Neomarinimicrobiota bacterium]